MDDLISRKAAVNAFMKATADGDKAGFCIDVINALLPVDAVPVRHGRWVYHPEIGWGSTWLCSECGEKTVETVMGEPRDNFCPNCGADMRKDGERHDG